MSHVAEFVSSDEDARVDYDLGPFGPPLDDDMEDCPGCGMPYDMCVCDDAYDTDNYDHTDPYAPLGYDMDYYHAQYDG